jgi:DNA recombination protein RmuC
MEVMDGLVGLIVGVVVTWLLLRARFAAALASAVAERTLLRERVADLESVALADSRTATMIGPLHESLVRVERQVHALERDRGEQFSRVAGELARVQSSTDVLRDQTASLVGSLRSSSVQGSWGEVQLRRVLELSGMLRHCDFDVQVSVRNDDGAAVRPDVVVALPGGKQLAVDAKAPLRAFLDAQAVGIDDEARHRLLRAHAKALRAHVDGLGAKGYWTALEATPELVVCFLPGESLLGAALAADPGLHEYALGRNVVLASPATLLAVLRSVAYSWRQEALTEGARELLDLGRQLYDRLGALGRHTETLGGSLRRSVEAYNAFVGSLEGRVLVTARRMNELGLAPGSLPTLGGVDAAPRPLTAAELIAALDRDVGRPDLPDLDERPRVRGHQREPPESRGRAAG